MDYHMRRQGGHDTIWESGMVMASFYRRRIMEVNKKLASLIDGDANPRAIAQARKARKQYLSEHRGCLRMAATWRDVD